MRKDLKKNKKGFTLVEIIVVLLIIGILLAITIPSIMGYVGKAKNAQLEAEARSGYVAAQTITARVVAQGKDNSGTGTTDKDGKPILSELEKAVAPANIAEELGEGTETANWTIQKSTCSFDTTNIKSCAFVTKSDTNKVIVFRTKPETNQDPTETMSLTDYNNSGKEAGTLQPDSTTK